MLRQRSTSADYFLDGRNAAFSLHLFQCLASIFCFSVFSHHHRQRQYHQLPPLPQLRQKPLQKQPHQSEPKPVSNVANREVIAALMADTAGMFASVVHASECVYVCATDADEQKEKTVMLLSVKADKAIA